MRTMHNEVVLTKTDCEWLLPEVRATIRRYSDFRREHRDMAIVAIDQQVDKLMELRNLMEKALGVPPSGR